MKREPRTFTKSPAARGPVPLWFGVAGASGGGKTLSLLRIAVGMQSVLGGKIGVIDTEADRALHYRNPKHVHDRKALLYEFDHFPFPPPFSPLDYLDAVRQLYNDGCRIIVIDSASHEHEGEGGVLDWHDRVVAEKVDRALKRQGENRERWKLEQVYNQQGWIEPKGARRAWLNGMLQLKANFLFGFRGKDSTKPGRSGEDFVHQGWVPIAGQELVFEMTACCILEPGAKGVPKWSSDLPGEKLAIKAPGYLRQVFDPPRQLDEEHGVALAKWARGSDAPRPAQSPATPDAGSTPAQGAGDPAAEIHADAVQAVRDALKQAGAKTLKGALELIESAGIDADACTDRTANPPALALERLSIDQLATITDALARGGD